MKYAFQIHIFARLDTISDLLPHYNVCSFIRRSKLAIPNAHLKHAKSEQVRKVMSNLLML